MPYLFGMICLIQLPDVYKRQPLKLPVIFLHLASPFFPVKGEESTAETEMRGDFLAINKLITSVF